MIKEGQVPTITMDEVKNILEECGLNLVKTRNIPRNLGYQAELVLAIRINEVILEKSETPHD